MRQIFKNILILKLIIAIVLINFSFITPTTLFAAFNPEINYQGRLLDNVGSPVADADFNVQFKLYTVASGGSPIWTETHCYSPDNGATCDGTGTDQRVATIDGLFSTMLGSISSIEGVDFNQTLYLGVNIGGNGTTPSYDGEMSPRKILGTVSSAFEAGKLDGISSEQFFRNDIVNATSSATTSLSIIQNGAGKIAEFFSSGYTSVLSILSSGKVGVGTTTPYAKLSVAGDVAITAGIYDNNATRGVNGYVLQTTGSGIAWVATSTLGITGGGGSVSIGGAVTSGTAGSVLFIDGSGNLAQDNSGFYFDSTTNYLNLGTSTDALVIGDITGNTRGTNAIDIQSLRTNASEVASAQNSVAIGVYNISSGVYGLALGYSNQSLSSFGVAIGGYNTAQSQSVALGYSNTASGNSSLAVGESNISSAGSSVGVGVSNVSSNTDSVAVGVRNTNSGLLSTSVGVDNDVTNGQYNSVFGYNNNLDAPGDGYSAVLGNSNDVYSNYSNAVGFDNTIDTFADSSSAFGSLNIISSGSANSLVFGRSNTASVSDATAFGVSNISSGSYSIAFGRSNTSSGNSSVAFGNSNSASGDGSTSVGGGNYASGIGASAFGYINSATGDFSGAFGYYVQATAKGASVFGGGGNGSVGSMINSVANSTLIGPGATTSIHILGTGEVKMPYFTATSTTATSTIAGNLQVNNNLQVGTGTLTIDTNSITTSGSLGFNVNGTLFNLPTSQGGAGYVLQNDGSGNLSWVATSTLGISAPGSDSYSNVLSNVWMNSAKTLPPAVLGYHQTAVIGDYVYTFGGYNGSWTNAIYRAPVSDPNTWTNTGSTLPGVLGISQIAVIGDYVYLFGGYTGSAYTNVIYRAPVSNPTSWTNTGSTLPGNLGSSQSAVIGDYVYLFGGNSGSYTNVIYRAPISNPTSWTNTGSTIPGNLANSQSAVIGDYVYLFGGYNGSSYTNVIYRAPVSNPTSWTNTGSTLTTTVADSSLVVVGDYVYIMGGIQGGSYSSSIYKAPVTNPTTWSYAGAALPGALAYSKAAMIGDYLYVYGGHNGSVYVSHIYFSSITSLISSDATVTTHGGLETTESWKYLPNGTNSTSGGVSTFQELTDTQNDLNANRIVYTNSGGTALTDTANFVFNGTNFGVGTSSPSAGISLGQTADTQAGGLWISATDGDYRSIYMNTSQVLNFQGGSGNTATLNALGAWTNASDVAYKENIAELEYGLAEIMQINARRYTWRSNGVSDIGFIAQELEEIIPEVVFGEEGSKTISYGQLGALTVRGLQEIGSRIDLLSAPTSTPSIKLDETGSLIVNNNLSVQNDAIFEKSLTVVGTTTSSFGGALLVEGSVTLDSNGISSINPFSINESQFYIATNGDVGIGTTTPARKLHVVREGEGSPVRFQDSNAYCEIDPTSSSWTCTSDQRLKENISAIENKEISEKIRQLRPVTFEWKTDESNVRRIGFIAQEVEVIFPEFVNTDETTGLKSVAYGAFVPYIISTLQDLADKIDALTLAVEEITSRGVGSVGGVIKKLTIGSSEKPVGVTLFDEATGDPYCLSIKNSNIVTKFGECSENTSEIVDEEVVEENQGNSNDNVPYIINIEENNEQDIDFEGQESEAVPEEIAPEVVSETVVEEEVVEDPVVQEDTPEIFIETNSSSGGGGLNII
ncbi:MAG: tail fiber domain-containing protein [Candidatus Pacebacteria bacterium]|nr:tail fiber domain-containing protein [Candidatus Paceibacterota bacterium]